ncbi:MAG: phosphoribosylanthranilate isomerase [Marinomonas sp.]|uniref:phosphoribosylanthranilate isomerase n=1 Tax=Marinomonas communis TaxID=28254 RepID=UPI000C456C6B|nr:phosphoribosylanthranilate isomerase [Marinomonas communis]MAF16216.1 phosphoribosylanthranilate isomerase [Marinomonas sp.]MCC4274678.1 phosphoribosylanthranilate isomerase [Marinomonas communis]
MSCRVKICGITNLSDALHASECGADALGFVFYQKSPRYISPEDANKIVAKLPPFITPVALFVDADEALVESVLAGSARWTLQFHGNESPEQCQRWLRPYFKAIRMKPGLDILEEASRYTDASAVLLDAYKAGVPGGTGETFDWHLIPDELPKPLILAGGLTAANVEQAVNAVTPYAVDVSGGVEQQKGIKDPLKVMQFITGAKRG